MDTQTFTLNIEPIGNNCVQVIIPEIGAKITVASTNRNEVIDAAHRASLTTCATNQPAKGNEIVLQQAWGCEA